MSPGTLLCAPSMRTSGQQSRYDAWCEFLDSKGLRVAMLCRADYEPGPWEQLARLISDVDGVVVLGFRQLEIREGLWRSQTPDMATVSTVWTSPWMQLEAGMAIASGKPVLAVPERGVSEGIFAPQNWTANVFGAPVENPSSIGAQQWAASVRDRYLSRSAAAPQ